MYVPVTSSNTLPSSAGANGQNYLDSPLPSDSLVESLHGRHPCRVTWGDLALLWALNKLSQAKAGLSEAESLTSRVSKPHM